MAQLTFLFTDLENSTGLWQQAPLTMQSALARHDAITQTAVFEHNGRIVKTTGDGLHAVFHSAIDGVLAALAMQQAMGSEKWPAETGSLKIRVGLHSGDSQERAGDYYGSTVNTAARVMDLGHGGQILLSEVTVLLLRGSILPEIMFKELGAYKLKGLVQPEVIYQLFHPDLVHEFPPLRSASVPKTNLPAETTPLIGREQELSALSALLTDPQLTLFTIIAPGGSGKSHLAIELGHRMVKVFANGVYFVELAPINDSENIVPALAEASGYQFQQNGRGQKQQILDFLANKEMLLIMDNYEHLLDDGTVIVTDMLQAAAALKILATSRYRLQLPGETLFTLHGLSLPENGHGDAAHFAAVELFQQSARRVQPNFELTPQNLPDVVQICRLVQGMPLGLLLAAAWVPVISTAEIAGEIRQGLDILEAEGSELPARQRSVRVVFDQAWSMMSAAEQDVFMKVSVFRGGFTRDAGHKVAGAGLRELQALINKALLERSADQGRYYIHELLRQYAAEKLQQSGQEQQVRDAHCGYYLNRLAQQPPKLKGAQQLLTLNEIEVEFKNIRTAWSNAVEHRAYDLIAQALEGLYLFCFLRSRLEDGRSLFEEARQGLAPAAGVEPHPVWLALGIRFNSPLESRPQMQKLLEDALAEARRREDELEVAFCLNSLGTLAHYVDQNPPQAVAYYEECAAIYQRLGETYYLAQTLSKLGEAYQLMGHSELTWKYVQEAYDLQSQIGDFIGESETLRALSMTAYQTGKFVETVAYQEKALALQLQTNYIVGQATSNLFLGGYKFFGGDYEAGFNQLKLALEQAQEVADFSSQAWCRACLSIVYVYQGDIATAEHELGEAKAIVTDPFRQTGGGNPFLQLILNLTTFLVELVKGNIESAVGYLPMPLQLILMTGSQGFMAMMPALAAFVYDHDGRLEKAVELIGLNFRQEAFVVTWLKEWPLLIDLQTKLQEQLGAETYAAAWQRGQEQDLMTVSQAFLLYLQSGGVGVE